jgi:hypothetical protein
VVKVAVEEVTRLKVKTTKTAETRLTVVKASVTSALGQPPSRTHHQKRVQNRMPMVARLDAIVQPEAAVAESAAAVEVAQEAGVHKDHREMVPLYLHSRDTLQLRGREFGDYHCI